MVNKSLGVFFKGFEDCTKRIKKFLSDFNAVLLVPSIGTPKETTIVVAKYTTREAMNVQVIDAPTNDPLQTSFIVTAVAKGLNIVADA